MTVRKVKSGAVITSVPNLSKDALTVLQPHADRRIRAFLRDPGDAEAAFWTVVYGKVVVPHSVAVAVAKELEACELRVADLVVAGWRPLALQKLAALQPRKNARILTP